MLSENQIQFVLQNRETLIEIAEVFLENYKNLIWKEKDVNKKLENSAVADRIEDLIATIKSLKLEKPRKKGKEFTGV
jgi:hypothetical protein